MTPPPLTPQQAQRLELATHYQTLPDSHLAEEVQRDILTHGGTLTLPVPRLTWGPLECELVLLGFSGSGDSIAGAARSWTRHALRSHAALTDRRALA